MKAQFLGLFISCLLGLSAGAQTVDTVVVSTNLFEPHSVALDANNNIYISDGANNRIVKVASGSAGLVSLAGKIGTTGTNDGTGLVARFSQPQGIVTARGGLVVADSGNNSIRFVTPNGAVSTLAGLSGVAGFLDGTGTGSLFNYPIGVTADTNGNIFVADSKNNAIRKIDNNNNVTTVATNFSGPNAVVVGDNGDLWVADTRENVIQRIASDGTVTIVSGQLGAGGDYQDGTADVAAFDKPSGLLWVGGKTGLLISDSGNQIVRRLYFDTDLNAYAVETMAGTPGQAGYVEGPALSARFNTPIGLAKDSLNGGFLVVDRANDAVRRIQSTAPLPPVADPVIGYVTFPPDANGNQLSKFTTVVDSLFNNDTIIAIKAEGGTETFFSFGATPIDPFNDTIPAPGAGSGQSPVIYRGDGLQAAQTAPSIVSPIPDMTIKAIGVQEGRRSSAIATARFRFKVATTSIDGDNASSIYMTNLTTGAALWYTIDGSDPTNDVTANPAALGPVASGDKISIRLGTEDVTLKVRGFRTNYKPSEITSKTFSPTNSIADQISFGFAYGEASSAFTAAAGQTFYAPVTLSLLPSATVYSLQFNISVSAIQSPLVKTNTLNFRSLLQKPLPGVQPPVFVNIPVSMFNGVTFTNTVFTNSLGNLIGVGWFERNGSTNLYDTTIQNLVTYSQAHDTQFLSVNGKVILGGFSFPVPTNAVEGSVYQIQIDRPSATSDGIATDLFIQAPTNGTLSAGTINSIKNVTIRSQPYIVGDVAPFRWYNAGDFGDSSILNNDVLQVFQSAVYSTDVPLPGSDFFDAMDSSNGTTNNLLNASLGSDTQINNIQFGDGSLNVDDVFVTYRRSLDPSLTWYARYWSNGVRQAVAVPNIFLHDAPKPLPPLRLAAVKQAVTTPPTASGENPFVMVTADDFIAGTNRIIQIPVRAQIHGNVPLRVLMMNLAVNGLDGSPPALNVQFSPSSDLGAPTLSSSIGGNHFAGAWLDPATTALIGTNVIGVLTITLPDGVTSQSAYSIHFEHFSGSPNGVGLIARGIHDGLITTVERSTSAWNDQIPDSWRLRYFGTVSNALSQASADADGDGVSNWAEFQAGTDPSDMGSKLQLTASSNRSPLHLQWPTVPGKKYMVESATSLFSSKWQTIAIDISGTGDTQDFAPPVDGQSTFYRVRLQQ